MLESPRPTKWFEIGNEDFFIFNHSGLALPVWNQAAKPTFKSQWHNSGASGTTENKYFEE